MTATSELPELWQWSACGLSAAIRDGSISCGEAVGAAVSRVRTENGRYNAIVEDLTEPALAKAADHDRQLAQNGPLGPLHGVPVTIKVNTDQEGQATTNGLPALKDLIAPADAPVVRNLKRAGAIIIGRTNTPEFSFRPTTDNPLHGRTINPWDEQRSPGGSSGGASAALTAGFGALAHGSDLAGSLRFPAFMCGLATVKPGFGRLPAYNPSAPSERSLLSQMMSTQGIIAREVRDVRLATEVMAAPDPRDPWHIPMPFKGPPISGSIKLAVARATNGYAIDPSIKAAIDRAATTLSAAGYEVEEIDPPMIAEAAEDARASLFSDAQFFMSEMVDKMGSQTIKDIFATYFELYQSYAPDEILRAMSRRTAYARAWSVFAEHYPLILTPFLMRSTYDWDEDTRGHAAVGDIFDSALYSWVINFLGVPAALAPAGYDNGLPISVQIVAGRFREDLALDAAEVLERANGIASHQLWRQQGWLT